MSDFSLEAAKRLPLADGCLRLLKVALAEDLLTDVYERYRGRSYTGKIAFPDFVHLLAAVVLGHEDSPHQAFTKVRASNETAATIPAWYGKLARLPIPLSRGLFLEATARLAAVGTPAAKPTPASLDRFQVLALDGKKLKYVTKRLKPSRKLKGTVYGSKLLVAQDVGTGLAVALEAAVDGETADNPLVPGPVAQPRSSPGAGPRLWLADRAFREFATLNRFATGPDQFLVRHHAKCKFHPDPDVPTRTGTDAENRVFREEWGWLGGADHPNRVPVRRITVERPGTDPLALVTSLRDADAVPAPDLLTLYRRRWGIETMFQQVVQVFDVRHLIGSTPQATVFQAAVCFLMYNTTLIVRDYVAAGGNRNGSEASTRLIFRELVKDLIAWMQVIGPDETDAVLQAVPLAGAAAVRAYLVRIVEGIWTDRWKKAKTTKRGPRTPPRAYLRGGHSSVDKILRGEHQEIPITPRPKTTESKAASVKQDRTTTTKDL